MQFFTERTIKLFSISGIILPILCLLLLLLIAVLSTLGIDMGTLEYLMYLEAWAIAGIGIYYIILGLFGKILVGKRRPEVRL